MSSTRVISMTGFGEAKAKINDVNVSCRVRSLNHRFLDTRIRLPRQEWVSLDMAIRKEIGKAFHRGSFDLNLTIDVPKNSSVSLINSDLAKNYLKAAKTFSSEAQPLSLDGLLRLPGVTGMHFLEDFLDSKTNKEVLLKVIGPALTALKSARQKEGIRLKAHLQQLLKSIRQQLDRIKKLEKPSKEKAQKTLLERCQATLDLLVNSADREKTTDFEKRLKEEAAFWIEKRDFEEERVRFEMHLEHLDQLLSKPPTDGLGRKLEFIQQELFREVNTLANKAQSVEISKHTVEIKSALEKMKEQLANVE